VKRLGGGAAIALSFVASSIASASTKKFDAPTAGAITILPDDPAAAPVLMVLHGDGAGPSQVVYAWEKACAKAGVILYAPKVPGPTGSWWKWSGDPSFLTGAIDGLAAMHAIERDRVYAAGWSGGATYLGWSAPALEGSIAAISYDGGGMAPTDAACPKRCALPAYFLEGDANPLHAYAKELRGWFDGCGADVRWDLVPKADHAAEWNALISPGKTGAILEWLLARPRTCAKPAVAAATTSASAVPSIETTIATPSASVVSPAPASKEPAPEPAHATRCGCSVVGERSTAFDLALAALAVLALAVRRRTTVRNDA
jgi:hypothetical protein